MAIIPKTRMPGNGAPTIAPRRPSGKAPAPSPARKAKAPASPPVYYANIHPARQQPVPNEFADLLYALEKALKMPLWFIINHATGKGKCDDIGHHLVLGFTHFKHELPKNKPIALLLDSPGGYARHSYQVANLIRKHCGGFRAIVPRYAKSAATLLALGADSILLGDDAELGPLMHKRSTPDARRFFPR